MVYSLFYFYFWLVLGGLCAQFCGRVCVLLGERYCFGFFISFLTAFIKFCTRSFVSWSTFSCGNRDGDCVRLLLQDLKVLLVGRAFILLLRSLLALMVWYWDVFQVLWRWTRWPHLRWFYFLMLEFLTTEDLLIVISGVCIWSILASFALSWISSVVDVRWRGVLWCWPLWKRVAGHLRMLGENAGLKLWNDDARKPIFQLFAFLLLLMIFSISWSLQQHFLALGYVGAELAGEHILLIIGTAIGCIDFDNFYFHVWLLFFGWCELKVLKVSCTIETQYILPQICWLFLYLR